MVKSLDTFNGDNFCVFTGLTSRDVTNGSRCEIQNLFRVYKVLSVKINKKIVKSNDECILLFS